jgi:hypothetical protein
MKTTKKVILWIQKEAGWQSGFIIILFIILLAYKLIQHQKLRSNANYIEGVSDGMQQGVRGHKYLHYHFIIANTEYNGTMPQSFCSKWKNNCCDSGKMVYVEYESGNPKNNELIIDNPE